MRNRKGMVFLLVALMLFSLCFAVGCGKTETPAPDQSKTPAPEKVLKMATTTSTQDSGLLDYLLPKFKDDSGYRVDVIAVGTGQALEMGKAGDVDVLLVHSKAKEEEFVAGGYGTYRKDVMYNDFIIIGPASDPAGIKGSTDVLDAFKKIANTQSTFISRGDASGTHNKELSVWEKAGIKPEGAWYVETGQGMGDTFRVANEKKAYTLIDRATFLANQKTYQLEIIVEGDKNLFNQYGVIPINPEKFPKVDNKGAEEFANWMISEKGQNLIGEFGKDIYGQALFVPNAK